MPKVHRNSKNAKTLPPTTPRWCISCDKPTTWIFNPVLGHSRCSECGGMFSSKEEIPLDSKDVAAKRLMPWIK